MYHAERKKRIKDILYIRKHASVASLAETLNVSTETIRRDLAALEDEGFLTKTYGGAVLSSNVSDYAPTASSTRLEKEIRRIASHAVSLIQPGNSIFIDHSTTASYLCDLILTMNLTVITNSLTVANHLSGCETISLILTGGNHSAKQNAFFGNAALTCLQNYCIDICFFSPRALDSSRGIFDRSDDEANLHRTAAACANKTVLLADNTKFGRSSFARLSHDFSEIDYVITDSPLSPEWRELITSQCAYYDFSDIANK